MINKSISVVIPAYNEEKDIKSTIESIYEFLQDNFSDFEIIAVDDGSTDFTGKILGSLTGLRLRVMHHGVNKGKGYSVKMGVQSAMKDYILLCDADLSTPLEEVNKLLDYIVRNYDIAIGSRALADSRITRRQGLLRSSMGKIFNLLVRLILFGGIRDTQCGFKCFKRDAAQKIFARQRVNRFCFDAEILYIAKRRGLKIKEVGVEWANRASSRVAILRDSLDMLADLFRVRANGRRGLYDVDQ